MTEEEYRELDYCICRYNCYFQNRPHIDRGYVMAKFLRLLRDTDGKINMTKFINLVQSK